MPAPHSVPASRPLRWRSSARLLALFLLPLAVAGCSPTYNWRELRLTGAPLVALMPCKPEQAQRPAPLGGPAPVELHMHSCEAGRLTFAVAWADLGDAARTAEAIGLWRRASLTAIKVAPERVDDPALQWTPVVPGAQQIVGIAVQGVQHAQRPVTMKAAHFAHGTRVYQAAIYGPELPDEIVTTFFEGLRLP